MIRALFLFLFLASSLYAQDFKADMEVLQEKYSKAKSISMKVSMQVFENGHLSEVSQQGTIKTLENNYFIDYGNHKTVLNEQWVLMVDVNNKIIACEPWSKEKAAKAQQQKPTFDGQKLSESYPKIEYKGTHNGQKYYVLSNDKMQFAVIEVFVDANTGYILEMKAYYNRNLYENEVFVLTKFSEINLDASFQKEEFSEMQFIDTNGKNIKGVGKYANFEIYVNE